MSGCNNCPAFAKCTAATYRGSQCSALRASYGLGDPRTNADHIRSLPDEELAKVIMCPYDNDHNSCVPGSTCLDCCLEWLQQPCEDSPTVEKG